MAFTTSSAVKRIGAFLIVLATLSAARQEGVPSTGALALGFALIAALLMGEVLKRFNLPRITGYLLFGVLCGPYMANIITRPMARDLQVVNALAVAFVAFIAGLELDVSRLRVRLGRILSVTGAVLFVGYLGLLLFFWAIWPWLPVAPEAPAGMRLAMAALAASLTLTFSPTVTIAVITDSRARGPLTDLVLAIVLLSDVALFVFFTLATEAVHWFEGDLGSSGAVFLGRMAWEILGSSAFGALLGSGFALYVRHVGRELTLMLLALMVTVSYVGGALGFQPLLSAIAAGLVFSNAARHQGALLTDAVRNGALPVLVVFFAAAGVSLNLEALTRLGALAILVSAVRLVLLMAGTNVGVRLTGLPGGLKQLLWLCLLSQGDVTLVLTVAVVAQFPAWGESLQSLVVAFVAIHEFLGPVLFKEALSRAGEVRPRRRPPLLVVSNREPYSHSRTPDGRIVCPPAAGGVAVALDALMRERGGVWIAHGSGEADRDVVDAHGRVAVPPGDPKYLLRRIWLTDEQVAQYYGGFANEGLWPLCHLAHVRPTFRTSDWEEYQHVNRLFAEAILEEQTDLAQPVFLNDYHVAMVAHYLRERRPGVRTALFWHIPWPNPDQLRLCPMRRELLEGLLANDLLAFQVERDCRNFLAAVQDELRADVDVDSGVVYMHRRQTRIVSVPIGVDFDRIQSVATSPALVGEEERLRRLFNLDDVPIVGVGVDRLDYTKGIPERLEAIDMLLTRRPGLRGQMVFVQVGVPSRSDLESYSTIEAEIDRRVEEINERHHVPGRPAPIYYHKEALNLRSLVALYRIADLCVVSSLQDGMNLVAKEFVAAREDDRGVLVLSEMAGAAEELGDALIINPYDLDGFVAALERAIEMPPDERARRMARLRRAVAGHDVFDWASSILEGLDSLSPTGMPQLLVPKEVAPLAT